MSGELSVRFIGIDLCSLKTLSRIKNLINMQAVDRSVADSIFAGRIAGTPLASEKKTFN